MSKRSVILFLGLLIFIFLPMSSFAAQNPQDASAQVSVSIGDYTFRLFGYGPPSALVTLEGVGIFDQVYSKKNGYFEFNNRFSPFSTREPCLYAQDQLGRTSQTICIPTFPRDRNVDIGPILLPPTVHLNKGQYFIGDQIILSGQTIPNTDVNLSYFIDQNKKSGLSLVKPAYAVSFPKLIAKSDIKGNYAISLPSSQADFFRVFAQDNYLRQDSPKSNTLSVEIFPWWMIIVQFFLLLWDIIRSRFLEIFILLQIVALIYYFFQAYLKPHVIARNKALALRKDFELLETDHEILIRK